MNSAIKVSKLSKRYRIGAQVRNRTLRERVHEIMGAPFDRVLRRANKEKRVIWALDEIDFDVRPGEVVGIIGRNGSGKSTLLKILSLITEPTTGFVELYSHFGSLLEVGTGFHPELTGRENIFLNGAILGMKQYEIRRHFDEIVAFAEMELFVDTPVKRYSSGMYLRLAFAVAAHLRAEILLIDEVLAVGDIEFQKKCLAKVKGIANEGRTVLFVSHNLGAVVELCPRVLWLDSGRLKLDGKPNEVISNYFATARTGTHQWVRKDILDHPGLERKSAVLRSVEVYQHGGISPGTVRFDKEFCVDVEYEIKTAGSEIRVILRLISELGITVFSSHDTDTPGHQATSLRGVGTYVSTCTIPGNLLHSAKYFVTVGITVGGLWVDLEEMVLLFEVSSIGNPLNPGRLGVISPVLNWNIRELADEQSNGNQDARKLISDNVF